MLEEKSQKELNYHLYPTYCSILTDGMTIRKHLDWVPKNRDGYRVRKFRSWIPKYSESPVAEATEAIVVMAVG